MKINKNQKLSTAGSLANLLPTGTVLAFQAFTPSISYNGRCHTFNKYLVAFVILVCSVICFVSSFIDSLPWEGKVYYGFATSTGLCVLNDDDHEIDKNYDIQQELKKFTTTKSEKDDQKKTTAEHKTVVVFKKMTVTKKPWISALNN
ncbi:uncharacterized protein Pyn_37117 [Prunus yedoensis var. nudiflora]|uniref:Transmembrane protein n=1 Tax=Prunus yedoensis var. nudiflora TaxID=2094558 RepID=A0A314ZFN9_PRUYE|nr:uncharacterized protein Pyn_37117 [Prunus yedoensis var. nudiflora]